MFEQDFILRPLQMLIARVMAAVRGRRHQESMEEVEQGWGELLGIPPGLLDAVDAKTLASMLGSADKQRAGAELLDADAVARDAAGVDGGERRRQLARELRAIIAARA